MHIEKLIYNLSSPLLKINRALLFLLLIVSVVQISLDIPIIDFISRYLGEFIVYCWIYAIGYAANQKLIHKGMALKEFRYFNWTFVVIAVCYLIGHFTTTKTAPRFHYFYYLSYEDPISIALPLVTICFAAYIFAIHIAAKALVMAEKKTGRLKPVR
jgi:hypothetical protein